MSTNHSSIARLNDPALPQWQTTPLSFAAETDDLHARLFSDDDRYLPTWDTSVIPTARRGRSQDQRVRGFLHRRGAVKSPPPGRSISDAPSHSTDLVSYAGSPPVSTAVHPEPTDGTVYCLTDESFRTFGVDGFPIDSGGTWAALIEHGGDRLSLTFNGDSGAWQLCEKAFPARPMRALTQILFDRSHIAGHRGTSTPTFRPLDTAESPADVEAGSLWLLWDAIGPNGHPGGLYDSDRYFCRRKIRGTNNYEYATADSMNENAQLTLE
jgi:hypothetical protein